MRSRRLASLLILLAGWVAFGCGAQTTTSVPAHGKAPAAQTKAVKPPTRPMWSELSHEQQQALKPLAQLWPTMRESHKRKWLALSRNFDEHSEDEKAVLQGRMRDWAALTPQQRTFARLNYADFQRLSNDEKRAKWEAYQALSAEDKQKLAKQQNKPLVGAAPAIKPTPAQNRVVPPPVSEGNKFIPRINTALLSPTTLLPLPAHAATGTSAKESTGSAQ